VIALAFYLRIIVTMYMEDEEGAETAVPVQVRWVVLLAVAATIGWGIFPGFLLDLASDALAL